MTENTYVFIKWKVLNKTLILIKNMGTGIMLGLLMIFAGIAVLTVSLMKPNDIEVTSECLRISGNYGIDVRLDDIRSAELVDSLPKIKFRTNGIGAGNIQVGHFRMQGIGKCRLYLNLKYSPFVHVGTASGEHIFFNTKNPSRTRDLQASLAEYIGHRTN